MPCRVSRACGGFLPVLAQLMLSPSPALAEQPTAAATSAEAEVRRAVRDYDEALRKVDVAAVEKFWASEYTFVNSRGERLTRADRLANLRSGRTNLDSLTDANQATQKPGCLHPTPDINNSREITLSAQARGDVCDQNR